MSENITVQCPTCKAIGVYEIQGRADRRVDMEDWEPIPCFLTPGCPGHIWPELAN